MSEKSEGGSPVVIVPDPNFIRVVADAAMTFFLGRDLEMATLAVSPSIYHEQSFEPLSAPENTPMTRSAITASNQFVETARVRMSPPAATAIAMNILQTLLDHGQIDEAGLRTQVEAMITMSTDKGSLQ